MDEIMDRLRVAMCEADRVWSGTCDEDEWLAAMTAIRDIAWEGKALILEKRWAERPRTPLKRTHPGSVDDIMDLLA